MTASDLKRNELVRKAIHLSSAMIPISYWLWFDRSIMIKGVSFMALGFLAAEYIRFHSPLGAPWFHKIFGSALRHHEHGRLTGATYVFTGALLNIFLFPKAIAVPALLILSISDTLAALVGIPFGKHRFLKKSLEGSVTFFAATLAILMLFFPGELPFLLIVAILVTLAEAYPMGLDDNFVIPTVASLLLLVVSNLG